MAKLIFKGSEVRKLFEHAKGCSRHVPTFDMLMEPAYLKEGVKLAPGAFAKGEDIDDSKVPAHLQLVKDDGAYLMSSGIPRLPAEKGSGNYVAYAKGLGKDADWSLVQAALGGDDFVEGLPLSHFQAAMDADATEVWLNVTANSISIGFTPGPNAPKPEKRERPKYDPQALNRAHRAAKATKQPQWASPGGRYKGEVLEVDGAVLYQLAGGRVVVHELALLPQPAPAKGSAVEVTYGVGINDMASVAPAKVRKAKAANGAKAGAGGQGSA